MLFSLEPYYHGENSNYNFQYPFLAFILVFVIFFFFFWPGHASCEILVHPAGIKPGPWQ